MDVHVDVLMGVPANVLMGVPANVLMGAPVDVRVPICLERRRILALKKHSEKLIICFGMNAAGRTFHTL
ncbi:MULTISPECIES: hypothetical protein [unclassified Paenibacillus]|uniref:hypothetical protein n=1 Tax=unclassified Paenibacillus TaxID=185978 RepID=UPI00095605B2|nr:MULTISPECIES: hypothetical protein [unclassified Paenibacillus]ASS67166.1 hypothetical protein CIC07_14230 [Paenibacillus sp. RUD330]SIQ87515.1 hypothetical protein SAMN05880555_2582 [Paenibacillus sp. RU4X]SIR08692.1 hypothetical protein SAMN05880570_2582 [Paenibacillus sp. RU4T]